MSSNPARRQLPGRISDDDCDCRPDGRQSVWKVCRGVGLLSLALGQMLPVNTKEGASRWMLAQPPARHLQPTICLLKPPCLAQRDTSRGNLSETPDFGCPWRLMVKFGYQVSINAHGASPPAPPSDLSARSLFTAGCRPNHDWRCSRRRAPDGAYFITRLLHPRPRQWHRRVQEYNPWWFGSAAGAA